MPHTARKAAGAHFTPPALARVLAERVAELMGESTGPLRILDPACGEGNLLLAMADALPAHVRGRVTLIGVENDPFSYSQLRTRLGAIRCCATDLTRGDFLESFKEDDLFEPQQQQELVDVIIANPPYVRTQVLGAKQAQALATRFGLSGRVDLYQAFLVAMAKQLRPRGILGVITSNRFLTTKAGTATRRFLRSAFDLLEIVDLGDTKLFDAAVLPALVFARKRSSECHRAPHPQTRFVRVYEDSGDCSGCVRTAPSIAELLRRPAGGVFRAAAGIYRVTKGGLRIPEDDSRPWTMLAKDESRWLASVEAAAGCRIQDVAKVRVGIKTTADDVFIRRDWHTIPTDHRPDPRFLRRLLSHENAAKWCPRPVHRPLPQVLYTHELVDGRRRAIRFDENSPTWRYLLRNKGRLESRSYVIEAGRAWYEIWVPQDPAAWELPKIVFPDISADSRFFLDVQGCIVNGDCYWITTNDPSDQELLLLILGVANSSTLTRYHDLAFQNRLYAQRRRHLTQYVGRYPLPDRRLRASKAIGDVVRRLTTQSLTSDEQQSLERTIDRLVMRAFALDR